MFEGGCRQVQQSSEDLKRHLGVMHVLRDVNQVEVGAVAEHHLTIAVKDEAARGGNFDRLDAVVFGDLLVLFTFVYLDVPKADHQQAGDQEKAAIGPEKTAFDDAPFGLKDAPH